ncbi:MAG: hypothetical protein M9937_00685 [Chelatococcus sp.]|nr:hypothetical protein [Chelatococcus sp.]CAH1653248.1 hypothetical protein CHELA20_10936 [Hyphomicrobiales bacterium]CAH1694314.1 hypothetical protein CHELA41_51167 [Hyphomicrobiales bacterium]
MRHAPIAAFAIFCSRNDWWSGRRMTCSRNYEASKEGSEVSWQIGQLRVLRERYRNHA